MNKLKKVNVVIAEDRLAAKKFLNELVPQPTRVVENANSVETTEEVFKIIRYKDFAMDIMGQRLYKAYLYKVTLSEAEMLTLKSCFAGEGLIDIAQVA